MNLPGYDRWKTKGPPEWEDADSESDENPVDPDEYGDYLYEKWLDDKLDRESDEES